MSLFDVAVIGGGIAGAAAALTVAGAGRSVLVIGPEGEAGDRPGEFLSPAANALLAELGLADRIAAGPHRVANATYAAWAAPVLAQRNAITHTEGPGRVLDRRVFERALTAAVAEAGVPRLAIPLAGAERDGVRRDGALWRLTLEDGTERAPRFLAARFLIDASGRAAVVARRFVRRRRADRLVAACDFLAQTIDDVEPTPATLIEAAAEGWWYATLLPDRRMGLAFFSDPDRLPRGLSRDPARWRAMLAETEWTARWLDSAGYRIAAAPRLASAGTTWLERAAGEGWAAAGDAAAAFDPLSSHGLTSALWAGRRAAQGALAMLDGDSRPLERYATTLDEAVRQFLSQRRAVYGEVRRFADRPFWSRRQ
ncbi:flavin-dependent dehydrogenase [Azospirillum lipoferum]|uniref:FAD-dependent oxidoreductase n=1 Tax=Azospirillum lipoferum TaxID=193 RepID=A0A5A9GPR5_AZOLI|nr:glycine oxidase maturase GoxB [Azospirillum lipoferum]KAA0595594.1 FAD-dependent oxidoreductase [Azospirillum lipoferum]MCP1611554.1 flavin-dependent dehydrogenase [Azospirillum lipoferum]